MRRWAKSGFIAVAFWAVAGGIAQADTLRVMTTGAGTGVIMGDGVMPINCTDAGGAAACERNVPSGTVVLLTATAGGGSTFTAWGGDCPDSDPSTPANQCRVTVNAYRSVRVQFDPSPVIVPLTDAQIGDVSASHSGIGDYLAAHTDVDTPAKFLAALPTVYKQDWLLMPRSESLQTGTAVYPRILLPNSDATRVFSFGLKDHADSYPGSHPNAVEFMQWDDVQKTFRFHEIDLTAIPMMDGTRFPARPRGVRIDDPHCFACHSTRNVLNHGSTPGTDGIGHAVPVKMKPNWDAYDNWGGELPFNRDRIYKGSVEAAAFRKMFNPWTWREDPRMRGVIEQLQLQPPGVPDGTPAKMRHHNSDFGAPTDVIADDRITRLAAGGADDGRIVFGFDAVGPAVTTEPQPAGATSASMSYEFNRRAGTSGTNVLSDPTLNPPGTPSDFVTLHHSVAAKNDAGRGVFFATMLNEGLSGAGPNVMRVVDELQTHRYATGSAPIDVRPLVVAIASGCYSVSGGSNISLAQSISPALPAAAASFFDARNGMSFDGVYDDTRRRQQSLTLRKADIQKLTMDRTGDAYVLGPPAGSPVPEFTNGLIQDYGAGTFGVAGGSGALDTSLLRLRQEIFRRPIDRGGPDATVMGGILVDREDYRAEIVDPLALFRYFLEPLGVSVDRWSTSVRGRSRTYTFATFFGDYLAEFNSEEPGSLRASLGLPASPAGSPPNAVCPAVTPLANAVLASLPAPAAVPTYTDVQRIFNKSCTECHGGLGYPPYRNYGGAAVPFDLSEDEAPPAGHGRLEKPYNVVVPAYVTADPATSYLYQRITDDGLLAHPYHPGQPFNVANPDDPASPDVADERCPYGLMPCGGPPLSKTDIETVRRWIVGGAPYTEGDPHILTVEGVAYDFQSAGEFTLLRDEGMELQVRQSPASTLAPVSDDYTQLTSCVSVNTAVALRMGSHRVTYQPVLRENRAAGVLAVRIDGKPVAPGVYPVGGGRVLYLGAGGVRVQLGGGTTVAVTPGAWNGVAFFNIDVSHARATSGVMGAISPGQWLPALPNGALLGSRPALPVQRHALLYKKFADAWRVTAATSLFDYEPGLGPNSFVAKGWPQFSPQVCKAPPMPGAPVGEPARPIPVAEAERICVQVADVTRRKHCIADVSATGSPAFAKVYLETEGVLAQRGPATPVLGLPANNAIVRVKALRFTWSQAEREKGGGVTYRHCLWDSSRLYNFNDCTLVAKDRPARDWARSVSDGRRSYFWKVVAEDANGNITESATRRFEVR